MNPVIQTLIACWCGLGTIGLLLLISVGKREVFNHFMDKPFKSIGIAALFVFSGPLGFFYGALTYFIMSFFKR